MDNRDIYEAAKENAFNRIKHIRNASAVRPEEANPIRKAALGSRVFDIGGNDYWQYSFIIEKAKSYSYDMFSRILVELLKRYGIDFKLVDFSRFGIQSLPIIAFVHKTVNGDILYIVKEYGYNHRIDPNLMSRIASHSNLQYRYVSLVENNAFSEIIDYNDNENDPTRGSNTLSLPFFLQLMFGEKEQLAFMEFAAQYTNEVRAFLGLSVTKTLTPSAQFSFRRSVEYEVSHFCYREKYRELLHSDIYNETLKEIRKYEEMKRAANKKVFEKSSDPITDAQWNELNQSFIGASLYRTLLGRADFAQSFLTAEWLFDSMTEAGRIDYSPVAMGYFKSVEQLIWRVLVLHKKEFIKIKRKGTTDHISINGPEINWNKDGTDTDSVDTTIGALIGALDFFPNRRYIFGQNIDPKTHDQIIIILHLFKKLRNGYTHKDNINDWGFISLVRDTAYIVYYLLLGACIIDQDDISHLGVPSDKLDSPYVRLCDYINYHTDQPYYLYDEKGNCKVAIGKPDDGIQFDDYGIPTFSGAHFQLLPKAPTQTFTVNIEEILRGQNSHQAAIGEMFMLNEKNMPAKIYSGVCYPVSRVMWYSGPQELIFENGKFVAPDAQYKPGY